MLQANQYGRIGVLMGGNSSERSISLRSGEAVLTALRQSGLTVIPVDIQGSASEIKSKIQEANIDIGFIALHGKGGEDGVIQNLLEELEIIYIGSNPDASFKGFNKLETKKIFAQASIPTPNYVIINKRDLKEKISNFPFPVFIKPLEEGSSIGVKKISSLEEMLSVAPKELDAYDSLMVEAAILGRELTVGILGDTALPVIELRPKREFYDYTAKYTKGMTEYLIPAPVESAAAKEIQNIALRAHRALGLRDFSRVDFMLDGGNRPFVLEVNTIPGFTETSLLPKAAKEAGLEFSELCLTLLQLAKERCLAHGKKK